MMGMPRGMISTKSDLLNIYFDVLTTDMPWRNFTLRLYARMLQIEDSVIQSVILSEAQKESLKTIFLSSVQALKKLHNRMQDDC